MKKIFSQRKRILFVCMSILLMVVTILICKGNVYAEASVKQEVRTVSYKENLVLDQSFLEGFDEHQVMIDNDDIQIVAKKSFDLSIFEEFDLVGLDMDNDKITVRYEVEYIEEDDAVFLTVTFEGIEDIPVIETIPGLITPNPSGELDVLFIVDGEHIWLSDFTEPEVINETGLFGSLLKKVKNAVKNVINAAVAALTKLVAPAARIVLRVAVVIGKDRALNFGAKALCMAKDEKGIYHADFACWQAIFGYCDTFDVVFDSATSMERKKFPFTYEKQDYILWAWKGQYWELGAGAELGIYKKWKYADDMWKVDTNLAMPMTLQLDYKNGENIFSWAPDKPQWWITGFNPNKREYLYVKANELKASYTVTFTNDAFYNAFKAKWETGTDKWSFTYSGKTASFSF